MPCFGPRTFDCTDCGRRFTRCTGDVLCPMGFVCDRCRTRAALEGLARAARRLVRWLGR